jgi:hypothetical protein
MLINDSYFEQIKEEVLLFLRSLETGENFKYLPVNEGLLPAGEDLSLGFSCYSLKINYMIGEWEKLDKIKQKDWISYINSFQSNFNGFPRNSYVDGGYIKNINKKNVLLVSKNIVKSSLNKLKIKEFETPNDRILNSIRAESKQAIATLYQVGGKNLNPYLDFPSSDEGILDFLNNLDWTHPWHAGAQYAGLCVFTKTQEFENKHVDILRSYADKLVDKDTGAYFAGPQPNNTELINGTMKMLTGFDWLDINIHYPEKLIDMCLSIIPQSEGCDIVDIIYVLYQSSKSTDYRKSEILKYLENLVELINMHSFEHTGGFSYYINKSQTSYYGVKFSKGLNTPDLHGTTLLIWALSMIKFLIDENSEWNTLKP